MGERMDREAFQKAIEADLRKSFHESIDTTLSGLQENPYLYQRVIAQENRKDGIIVKKKIPATLVLIIVLVLLTMGTALAVSLLTGKQFVEETLVPQATVSNDAAWTPEEIKEIKRQIEKQGMEVTPEIESKLISTNPVYKEELMRLFIKKDLGYYPASWPIEEQAWFDDLLVELHLREERTRFIPEEGEITQEQALQIMAAYAESTWGTDQNTLLDAASYHCYLEYRQMISEDGVKSPRSWYARFETDDSKNDTFDFVVTSSGEIVEAHREPGIHSADDLTSPEKIFDYYGSMYGLYYEWEQAVWESFVTDLRICAEKYEQKTNLTVQMMKQGYGRPSETDISEGKAIQAAREALVSQLGIEERLLNERCQVRTLYLVGSSGGVWKVIFVDTHPATKGRLFELYHAEINVVTGEVSHVTHYQPGKNSLYEAYFLVDILNDFSDWSTNG